MSKKHELEIVNAHPHLMNGQRTFFVIPTVMITSISLSFCWLFWTFNIEWDRK